DQRLGAKGRAPTEPQAEPVRDRVEPAKTQPAPARGSRKHAAAPVFTPKALAESRAEAARNAKFERASYETVRNLARLDAWVERAYATGVLAINTTVTSADPMQAQLVGISLAVAPGEACYVPLTHRDGNTEELFAGALLPDQVPIAQALDAL